jgi:hypothetical protein
VASSSEHGNKARGSIKGGEILKNTILKEKKEGVSKSFRTESITK